MVQALYDWSGFYIGLNGGGGSSHKCWDFSTAQRKAATMRPAAPSVARSAIAGRPARSCSASKRRATGLTSPAIMSSLQVGADRNHTKIDAFGLFTGQVGYA